MRSGRGPPGAILEQTGHPQLPYCKPANSGLVIVLGPLNSAGGRLGEKLHVQGSSGPERPLWSIAGFRGATFETSCRLSKPLDFRPKIAVANILIFAQPIASVCLAKVARFSECPPSGTNAVSDRVYSNARAFAPLMRCPIIVASTPPSLRAQRSNPGATARGPWIASSQGLLAMTVNGGVRVPGVDFLISGHRLRIR
jgi:hypothetical protein